MTHYIYIIENLITGKFYIGRTKNPANRKRSHFSELKRNVHGNPRLQFSFNKYGANVFEFKVVDSCNDNLIESKEAEWFNAFDNNKYYLYNCHFNTHGGPSTCAPHTVESKFKISEAIKNRTRKYIFEVLDEGYASKIGLSKLAKKFYVGANTLITYKTEWEELRGVSYGHPQSAESKKRVGLFVHDFVEIGIDAVKNLKQYKVSYKALKKYLPEFGLTIQDIRLDQWKSDAVTRAKSAAKMVTDTGCSVSHAVRECGASITTYYKYV